MKVGLYLKMTKMPGPLPQAAALAMCKDGGKEGRALEFFGSKTTKLSQILPENDKNVPIN